MEGAQWQDKALCGPGSPDPRTALRKLADRAAYKALRGVWSVLESASLARARGGLERLADLFARADRNHRRVVEENLEIAFPSMDSVVRDSVVRATFQNWGRIIAEIAHCDDVLAAARSDPDWASLRAAVAEGRASGRGLLLLTAHIGNFELLARIFGSLVAPVAVFHRSLGVAEIDRFVLSERERCGVTTLGRGGSVRDALRILAGGGCVAVPLDQNQREGRGIFIDVLGHPACTSTMLARLSLATGAPVLPVFSIWQGDRTAPVLCELISPPEGRLGGGERESALRDLTERYGREVDWVVRRFPHQWNWAHRRWKTRPRPSAF